jgi:hypothetical protein
MCLALKVSAQTSEADRALFEAARLAAKSKPGEINYSDPNFDRGKYSAFVAPEATKILGQGERKVTMVTSGGMSGLKISRTLTNPYIPVEAYVLLPRYTPMPSL